VDDALALPLVIVVVEVVVVILFFSAAEGGVIIEEEGDDFDLESMNGMDTSRSLSLSMKFSDKAASVDLLKWKRRGSRNRELILFYFFSERINLKFKYIIVRKICREEKWRETKKKVKVKVIIT